MSLDVWLYMDIDTGGKELKQIELFEANITHNLTGMADAAGIYTALWHPEDMGAKYAGDIVGVIEKGLEKMKSDPEKFEAYNAHNGWGLYEHFVPWVEKYLEACKEHPRALIGVSI